jgi:hypothetical protein
MSRNEDVRFLRSDLVKLWWYEYYLLDMLVLALATSLLTFFVLLKCLTCFSARRKTKEE